MARFENIRERLEFTFFDTLLSPEIPEARVNDKQLIFQRAAPAHLNNVDSLINMTSDQSFTLGRIRIAFFFEAFIGDLAPVGHVMAGTVLTPLLNGKPLRPMSAFHMAHHEGKPLARPPMIEVQYQCGPIGKLPRMPLAVEVAFSPTTVQLINETRGKKFFRVFLDGVIARDVC